MKRFSILIATVAAAALIAFSVLWSRQKPAGQASDSAVRSPPSSFSRARPMPSSRIPTASLSQSETEAVVNPATTPALTLVRNDAEQNRAANSDPQLLAVKQMLRDYRAALGEEPVGNNSEITKALLGANSRKARFVTAEAKLNSDHQLVDRWNHPYFFHQLSRTHMEVRSSGPDGVMWTADDEVSF